MFRISKDSPAYYLTSVTNDRLPFFRTTALKDLACCALDEARHSAGFFLLTYVVMPDHLHAIVGSELKPSKVLQYINGILSRRVIDYLKTNNLRSHLVTSKKTGKAVGDLTVFQIASFSTQKLELESRKFELNSKLKTYGGPHNERNQTQPHGRAKYS